MDPRERPFHATVEVINVETIDPQSTLLLPRMCFAAEAGATVELSPL
jgi:hypothetical protein